MWGFACATATYDYRDLVLTRTDGLTGGTCASGGAQRTVTTSYDGLGRAWRTEVTAGTDSGDPRSTSPSIRRAIS